MKQFSYPRIIRTTLVALACMLAVTGCMARSAQPVARVQTDDLTLSCEGLQEEIVAIEADVQVRLAAIREDRKVNLFAVTGLSVPVYEPDMPEQIEIEALVRRQVYLEELARSKSCNFTRFSAPPDYHPGGRYYDVSPFQDYVFSSPGRGR